MPIPLQCDNTHESALGSINYSLLLSHMVKGIIEKVNITNEILQDFSSFLLCWRHEVISYGSYHQQTKMCGSQYSDFVCFSRSENEIIPPPGASLKCTVCSYTADSVINFHQHLLLPSHSSCLPMQSLPLWLPDSEGVIATPGAPCPWQQTAPRKWHGTLSKWNWRQLTASHRLADQKRTPTEPKGHAD